MKNRWIVAILLVILLLGAYLRFHKIGATAFDRDEFFELNSSYGYFKTGEFVSWDFGNGEPFGEDMQDDSSNERAEVFRWQLAQLYRLADPSEGLTRGLGAAWGVFGVLLIYLIAASLTGNRYVGLIAAFLTAVGYSEVLYSRRLRMYAMFFPAYLLFSWTVFRFYESEYKGKMRWLSAIAGRTGFNPAYFLPVLLTGLVSLDIHVLTAHIAPVLAAFSLVFSAPLLLGIYNHKLRWKEVCLNKYLVTLYVTLSGLLIYQLPIFEPAHKLIGKNFRFFLSKPNYDFFSQYFSDFRYPIIGVVLFLFGTWFVLKKLRKPKAATFLFLSAAVPLAFAIFTWRRDVSHRYIYFIQPFGIILSAVGVYGIARLLAEKIDARWLRIVGAVALLALLTFGIDLKYVFSKKSDVYTQSSYYPAFRPVYGYVLKNKIEGDVMVTRAYRSYYWQGSDIKVYDIKKLGFGGRDCDLKLQQVVQENRSGWVVYPKVDSISFCSAGRKYAENNLVRIEDESVPSGVALYRWGE